MNKTILTFSKVGLTNIVHCVTKVELNAATLNMVTKIKLSSVRSNKTSLVNAIAPNVTVVRSAVIGPAGPQGPTGYSGAGGVPTLVKSTEVYTIVKDTQVLFSEEINMEYGAEISIDGILTEVR